SEEMFTEMYMLSELSDENLLNITRKIYPNPIWEKIDDDLYERRQIGGENYYLFWAVEKLSEVVVLDKDKRYKLDEVGFLYAIFNYPDDWYPLIYYNPPKKGEKMGIDVLYDDLIEYIDSST
uniref:DUF2247 family protein n=1 Tax=Capnocytophaga ochracea TaxID=1018 RepID=UPI00065FDDF4